VKEVVKKENNGDELEKNTDGVQAKMTKETAEVDKEEIH